MTRIVAGTVGGRTIQVPARGTRPTSDRVREAIFSRLEHLGVVDGARVLDLFAGSGALGLEAASRGAASVTLVDSARVAVDVARRNVATLALPDVRVVAQSAETFAAAAAGAAGGGDLRGADGDRPYHLVFLDPPYDLGAQALERVLDRLAVPGVLDPTAVVVVERSARTPEPAWPAGWEVLASKAYGETAVWFAGPAVDDADEDDEAAGSGVEGGARA
ncbi:16S rRNA (guanine(966)-N(2))-methyltransferase RsmD [Cellulosimicrobium sp. CUA-896]|uniref:16S rRNA (guanine(966)-N(2))-methyltransferase RsmD n=1 Tax=Cellulosimicrobium sp. CUA-896 TaxID=1517881 RepID=UPI000963DC69|nr:16S rRNA (guanine(966)-N(2))-methyltransferase RsmD [Cellulosimicrobium sp. CUA-896]OLT53946.1 16S rRNA (guanine(966)-N(2))-methyltransferase RsmD [Cellulosimicrobium sp. CUA-896]